jgi:hypothetical protein
MQESKPAASIHLERSIQEEDSRERQKNQAHEQAVDGRKRFRDGNPYNSRERNESE